MTALTASRVTDKIVSHAWNANCTQVAICGNENVVHIYEATPDTPVSKWKLLHTLQEHDQHVSSVDWAPTSNLIVTCSHDRNAYVWNEHDGIWQVCAAASMFRVFSVVSLYPALDPADFH
jgi:actin related protein 2/3 complex, subunit 1A/1B